MGNGSESSVEQKGLECGNGGHADVVGEVPEGCAKSGISVDLRVEVQGPESTRRLSRIPTLEQ